MSGDIASTSASQVATDACKASGRDEHVSRLGGSGEVPDSKQSRKKRRRSSAEEEEEGQSQWAFLNQMEAVDQSWLHFALYSAYQQQK